MAKNFSFTFSIDCLIGRSFNGSIATTRSGLINVRKDINSLNAELTKINQQKANAPFIKQEWLNQEADIKNRIKFLESKRDKLSGVLSAKNKFGDAVSSLTTFGTAIYGLSAPIVGVISTAAEFEKGMSKVAAITRANSEDMAMLTAKAKELGATTQFTARQAADAMSYLGMAGWDAQQIAGGMPGLLSLAAAGGTDLARTADIVSDDLTAFGLSADKAGHMADVFAYTITRTNTNVEMLGETMKYSAPVAHAFGVSMEETAALAGLMANSGIKASQAGTSLRSGFLRLAGPPKQASKAMEALGMDMSEMSKQQAEAQAAMKSLGIELSDTNGPRKMGAIITELRNKMAGLSKEERLATVGAIFGKNASSGWLAVIDSAPNKFQELVNEMDKCDGEAKRMADTMNNNAQGAMVRLQSAMEGVAVEVGGVFLPMLADAGEGLAGVVGGLAQWAGENQGLVRGIGLVTVAMAGAIGVFKVARVVYAAYRVVAAALGLIHLSNAAAMTTATTATVAGTTATAAATAGTWAFNAALLANPIGLIVVGIAGLIAAGYALYKNWDTVSAGLVSGWNWIKDTASSVLANIPEKAGYAVGLILGWFTLLPRKLLGIISNGLGIVGTTFIDKAKEWGQLGVDGIIDAFFSLPKRLAGIVSDAWASAKNAVGSFTIAVNKGIEDSGGTNGSEKELASNASGGIYGKGAFLTTFAEESGESAIPHEPTKRNVGLLAKTNQIMGNPLQPNINVYSQFNPMISAKAETPNINVQAPAVTIPDIPPAVMAAQKAPTVNPVFNPTFNAMASTPDVTVPPAVVKQPAINVQQADMTVPAPVIRIPESKPILQAPPVVNNIIKAVADSPVVKTFVKAVAAVPDIIVNPASPVLKPIITAMAKVPDVIVNQDEAPAIYPQAPNVSPVVNVPKADTPIVNAVTKVTEMAPILRPIFNAVAPAVSPIVNAIADVPELNTVIRPILNVAAPIVNAMADVPALAPVFRPILNSAAPVVNVPGMEAPKVNPIINATAPAPNVNVAPPAVTPIVNPAATQNVVNVPKMDAPRVSPVIQATATSPVVSPVFNPLFNVPNTDNPQVKISQRIQTMAQTPAVTALFNQQAQPAGLADINVPQSTQKETLVERIKEIVRPQERAAETAPINITFSPNIVVNGNTDRQEVQQATEMSFQKFRELMEQFQREQRRVQYG